MTTKRIQLSPEGRITNDVSEELHAETGRHQNDTDRPCGPPQGEHDAEGHQEVADEGAGASGVGVVALDV